MVPVIIIILLFFIVIFFKKKNISKNDDFSISDDIPLNASSKVKIGMDYKEVVSLIDEKDIIEEKELGNGYKWVYVWINPFDERIRSAICFNPYNQIKSVTIFPQITENFEQKDWKDACEENMELEYNICREWYSKYKKYFPKTIEVFKDIRNFESGIIIT